MQGRGDPGLQQLKGTLSIRYFPSTLLRTRLQDRDRVKICFHLLLKMNSEHISYNSFARELHTVMSR